MVTASRGFGQKVARSIHRGTLFHDVRNRLDSWLGRPLALKPDPTTATGTHSSRRLNAIAGLLDDPRDYLEVGVEAGRTFEAVQLPHRVAVEPSPHFSTTRLPKGVSVSVSTSDAFFADLGTDVRFDLVFLDGLHTYDQTYRDLIHALAHGREHTVVLVDDVVPSDRTSAIRDFQESQRERVRLGSDDERWHGDVFRLILLLRDHHPELGFRTLIDGSVNAQAVVWRSRADLDVVPVSPAVLSTYEEHSYDEVFASGVPEAFRPGPHEAVMEDVARSLRMLPES